MISIVNQVKLWGARQNRHAIWSAILFLMISFLIGAAMVGGDTRISYKKGKRHLELKDLSLASPEQVQQVTGAEVGYVSLINSGNATIIVSRVAEMDTIYGGCGTSNYTLQISSHDLISLTQAQVFNFTEPKDDHLEVREQDPA